MNITVPGNRIVEFREEIGLSQIELSRLIGLSRSSVQKYERGNMKISLKIIKILERIAPDAGKFLLGKNEVLFKSETARKISIFKTIELLTKPRELEKFLDTANG